MRTFLKEFFRTRWDVLDVMEPDRWYFGFELAREHGFSRGTIHIKLGALEDEGFVRSRLTYLELPDGSPITRRQYTRTGKMRRRNRVSFRSQSKLSPNF